MTIIFFIITASLHYKKDGTLDMRYKSSREFIQTQNTNQFSNPYSTNINTPNHYSTRLYTSADIKLNKDGSISRRSRAVTTGEITFDNNGRIDPNCDAVLLGHLILNNQGQIDTNIHTDLEIPKNPGYYKTSIYRHPYEQHKFRKESGFSQEYDASHIVDLEIARAILKNKPDLFLTASELHSAMKPLNKLLEMRPKSVNRANRENPDNDHAMAQRIIRLINGENVHRTRALDEKIMNMIVAIHSIPSCEMNPIINYILNEIEKIKPQIIQLY